MSRASALVLVLAFAAGCESGTGHSPAPLPLATAPADWVDVAADGGDVRVTLPPWLVAFETSGGIFANEPPPAPGAQIPVQLYAEGPDAAALPAFVADARHWIEGRVSGPAQGVANPGEGAPVLRQVQLPAGSAIRYERVDRAGTALEWRFLVFAIRSASGVAYLQIDGTPGGWAARSQSFDLIALLLRTR